MNGDVGKELCGEAVPTQDATDEASTPCEDQGIESSNSPAHISDRDQMLNGSEDSLPKDSETMVNEPAEDPSDLHPEAQDYTPDDASAVDCTNSRASPHLKESSSDDNPDSYQPQKEPEGSATDNNQPLPSPATVEPMTREKIKQLVLEQVQYFFSRENWSRDPYLLSQMDSDQYVPVYILANCSQFKSITKDHSIILEALKESLYVQLDEKNTRVRPNYKRCIVLLREIPECTPKEEIEAMFQGEGCPKVVSCEFVHNDFWYVTFDSDNDAQKAYTYLRETVKTFKDKPILARMKSKPMSRLGCFSVLPSYGGRAQGENKENAPAAPATGGSGAPPQPPPNVGTGGPPGPVPGGPPMGPPGGMPPGPTPPNVPGGYGSGNQPRIFFSAPNNVNPPYYYNSGSTTQMPPAYFYPNPMVQWAAPNFYDINGFIQYNGLTPRGTYKPPTSTNNRYNSSIGNNNNVNNNRRNKTRDNIKFDKNENRHPSGNNAIGGQPRHPQPPSNRPPSVPSPHPNQATQPTANQSSQPINNSQKESSNSLAAQNGHNIFAQNDPPLASQSNLYTSFSPPAGNVISRGAAGKLEKNEVSSSFSSNSPTVPPISSHVTNCSTVDSTSCTTVSSDSSQAFPIPQSSNIPSTTGTTSLVVFVPTSAMSTQPIPTSQTHYNMSHQPPISHITPQQSSHYHQQPHSLPIPPPHRNGFNNEHHSSSRDSQPQRPMGRGGRRRGVPRREDEVNGISTSNGRPPLRGPGPNAAAADFHARNASPHPDMKKPQFELKETSFPPLPGADEGVIVVPEEKAPEPVSQAPWSGDTQKFSDVMKGTAKPKPTQNASDKESLSDDNSSQTQPSQSESSISKGAQQNSIQSTSQLVNQDSSAVTTIVSSTNMNTIASSAPTSNVQSTNTVSSSSASTTRNDRMLNQPREQQRPQREERRVIPQNIRREYNRDFTPGIGRGGNRRDREPNTRFPSNKEARPQAGSSYRSWREDRPDPEGWITKGPRDTRNHRENRMQQHHYHHHHHPHHNHHSHHFYDNRNLNNSKNTHMVNGDASPPLSPKPEAEKVVSNNGDSCPDEPTPCKHVTPDINEKETREQPPIIIEQEKNSINNNEGEHKPSWAKMALASKDEMEKLSAKMKEKDEQERLKKMRLSSSRSQIRMQAEKPFFSGRERESKPFRREAFPPREKERVVPTEFKANDKTSMQQPPPPPPPPQTQQPFIGNNSTSSNNYRAKDSIRPKSPK